MKKSLIIALSVFTLMGAGCGQRDMQILNVDEFVEVVFEGVSGEAELTDLNFDSDTLEKVLLEQIGKDESSEDIRKFAESMKVEAEPLSIKEEYDTDMYKPPVLTNGDKLKLTLHYDKNLAEKLHYEIEFSMTEYTVENLETK